MKAALRLGINASPEPFTNIVMSVLEDIAVAVVIALMLEHPVAAATIALILLGTGIALALALGTTIKRGIGKAPRT